MNANVLVAKKWHIPFLSERKASRENFRLNFQNTILFTIAVIAILGIYYVYILNQNATKGYNIRSLQVKNRELLFQENLLDIRIAEGQAVSVILNSPIVSTMEAAGTPTFIVNNEQNITLE